MHNADQLINRIRELEAENAELRRDAKRYRWLRAESQYRWFEGDGLALVVPETCNSKGEIEPMIDTAIDAAMKDQK